MKRIFAVLLIASLALMGAAALGEGYRISDENASNFGTLLIGLLNAYEHPSPEDAGMIEMGLEAIGSISGTDRELAEGIVDHWNRVYLDPDYRLYIDRGEGRATELEQTDLEDSASHAFVVLGYELENGEMTDELKGRCAAAAAAARSFPASLIICTGGATGKNNPNQHTEAGMMKAFLADECGVEPSRIHIDESAMTTVENAINTFRILRDMNCATMTIVTSTYHQRWGQAIYNAVGQLYRLECGYSPQIVANYCFDIEPAHDMYRRDAQIAVRQLAAVLKLPDDVVEKVKNSVGGGR